MTPSDTPRPATLLPMTGHQPLSRIGIDNINAHIAAVTAQPHVPNNRRPMQHTGAVTNMQGQGTAQLPNPSLLPPAAHTDARYLGERGASVCISDDPVIPFVSKHSLCLQICLLIRDCIHQDDKCTTVSGRKYNPFGTIGSPLSSGSDPQVRGLLPTAN